MGNSKKKWGMFLLVIGVVALAGAAYCWLVVSSYDTLSQDPEFQLRMAFESREVRRGAMEKLALFRMGSFGLLAIGLVSFFSGVVLVATSGSGSVTYNDEFYVPDVSHSRRSKQIFCKSCGTPYEAGGSSKFCENCGERHSNLESDDDDDDVRRCWACNAPVGQDDDNCPACFVELTR